MNINLKRRYFETRVGTQVISPLMTASTLIGVAYLYIQDVLPIWVFVPIFAIIMITITTVIGFKFRGIQLSTDQDMMYEKQKELNSTFYEMMVSQKEIMEKLGIKPSTLFMKRLNHCWNITGRTI